MGDANFANISVDKWQAISESQFNLELIPLDISINNKSMSFSPCTLR